MNFEVICGTCSLILRTDVEIGPHGENGHIAVYEHDCPGLTTMEQALSPHKMWAVTPPILPPGEDDVLILP